jgi:tRNA modification GTPase
MLGDNMIFDTIVGVSTAIGYSAINVIRVSGIEAFEMVSSIFKGKDLTTVLTHTVHYGHIVFQDAIIDEVVVTVFKAPRSFTTENVVEISVHGGSYIASLVLEALISKGARLAEPGEFTRRAYLNGRIDLTQAESIMDMINAKTRLQLQLATSSLSGDVRKRMESLQTELLDIIAIIEVNIDYPEYDDVVTMTNELIIPKIKQLIQSIQLILEKADSGKVIRDGIKTVIVGKPNVGKSSLLNTLLNEDKAIVTDISGTTRDLVEGELRLGGLLLRLIDTAGVRETEDIVEKIGIDKTKKALEQADLVILVLDQSRELSKEDELLLTLTQDKKRIIVGNKADLGPSHLSNISSIISLSAKTKQGMNALEVALQDLFIHASMHESTEVVLGNTRHIGKMQETLQALQDALHAAQSHLPIDMVEIDVKNAWTALGEITGDVATDQLIQSLFSKFCLGK